MLLLWHQFDSQNFAWLLKIQTYCRKVSIALGLIVADLKIFYFGFKYSRLQ